MVFLHIEGDSLIVTMVNIYEEEELLSAFVQISSHLLFFLMVWEGEDSKRVDSPYLTEFLNLKCSQYLIKNFPIRV